MSDDSTGATRPDAPAPKAARRAATPPAASETPKPRADVPEASAPPPAPAAATAPAPPAAPAKVRLRVTHGRIVTAGYDNGAPVGTVLEMSAADAKRIVDVGVAEYVK